MKQNHIKKTKKKYTEPTLKQFGLVRKVTQKNTQLHSLDHGDNHHRS